MYIAGEEWIMLDAAIVGTGPAGLSAALNLALHQKSLVWFGAEAGSDKVEKSEKIANYPGFGLVTGTELNQKLAAHAAQMGLTVTDKQVTNILPTKGHYMLLADNQVYEAKTLLLATGASTGKGLEGESALLGRGVSYCATCDGFLYKGKTIGVFCGHRRFEHEVTYLADLAQKVYLFTPYKDCSVEHEHVELLTSPIRQVLGQERVTGILLADGRQVPLEGVFFLRPTISPETLLPGLKLEGAHIEVNRQMQTNLPGCFAAGDCTGRPYQIAKSVGEGNVAAHSMVAYLADLENQEKNL
jgi:thioredoxin reductase (NADPH)